MRRRTRQAGVTGLSAVALVVAAVLWWVTHPQSVHCPDPSQPEGLTEATVVDAVDGDTIDVRVGGRTERVRLIGVDTPELHDRRRTVRALAQEAARFTRSHLVGRRVGLELDVQTHDRFGRLLAYVWVSGRLYNLVLLEEGYARVLTVPPNVRYAERFRACERMARERALGLWAHGPLQAVR